MFVKRDTMTRSRNRCYSGETTMCSVHIVELPVNYIKIHTDAQQCFFGSLMSPATIKKHAGIYVKRPTLR
jgi:hypothetical protein